MTLAALLLSVLTTACSSQAGDGPDPAVTEATAPSSTATPSEPTTTSTAAQTTTTPAPDPILLAIEAMTVEQKVGQMLMPVVAGTSANQVTTAQAAFNQALAGYDTPAEIVDNYQLGGLMYLGPNVISTEQIATFSAELQQSVSDQGGIALFIAADQEGGRVRRIRSGVTEIGSARSFGGDVDAIRESAQVSATEMMALGINMILAPVADVVSGNRGVIGDRSYSEDPAVAGAAASAASEGIQAGGALSVVKHWPGHGATEVDSHKSLPEILAPPELWAQRDAAPFAAVIDSGVDAVMVGHLAFPEIDPSGVPATVSPVLVQQLLRDEYGFDGLVMTDAMDMGAVSGYDRGELGVLAVLAGIDVLLAPPDLRATQAALLAALEQGRITEDWLNTSVERILRAKARLGL